MESSQKPKRAFRRWFLGAALVAVLLLYGLSRSPAFLYRPVPDTPPSTYEAGRAAFDRKDYPAAIDHWKRVPPSNPNYAKAMRFLGWELHTERLEEPHEALRYVNAALLASPLDGNVWQDWGRTYGQFFGLLIE